MRLYNFGTIVAHIGSQEMLIDSEMNLEDKSKY